MGKEPLDGPVVVLPGGTPFLADLDGLKGSFAYQTDDRLVGLEAKQDF